MGTCCGDYLTKIGLEIAASTTKQGRNGSMSPWAIARLVASGTIGADLWRQYAHAMSGCHQLQWSRGLHEAIGPAPDDAVICGDQLEAGTSAELICDVPRETWRMMAASRGALGELHAHGRTARVPIASARDWLCAFLCRRCEVDVPATVETISGRPCVRWGYE